MAAAKSKTTTVIKNRFDGETFMDAVNAERTRLASETGHTTPGLAAVVRATRTVLGGISQMQLGKNRGPKNERYAKDAKTPADLNEGTKGAKKSGWFSLIANVEQGGRKTTIPSEFITYLAAVIGGDAEQLQALVDEDSKLLKAANAPAPEPEPATAS